LAVPIALTLLFLFLEWRLYKTLDTVAVPQARRVVVEAIQQAVLENLRGEVKYSNLIQPGTTDGKVVFMAADALEISRIQARAQLAIQERLAQMETQTYHMPLGQVLGVRWLAAYGPRLPLRFIPLGVVKVHVGDNFESSGINQTRHRIYLEVEGEVQIMASLSQEKVKVTSTLPLTEAIIVGPVPQTYVNFSSQPMKGILHSLEF